VFEALRKVGLGDRYIERLAPWRGMLALGLTSAPEKPEPTRSDTHAWSAHPNYGMLATVLGVRPSAPGFRTVLVAPSLGPLRTALGRVPHHGETSTSLWPGRMGAGSTPRSPFRRVCRARSNGEADACRCARGIRRCVSKSRCCVRQNRSCTALTDTAAEVASASAITALRRAAPRAHFRCVV